MEVAKAEWVLGPVVVDGCDKIFGTVIGFKGVIANYCGDNSLYNKVHLICMNGDLYNKIQYHAM